LGFPSSGASQNQRKEEQELNYIRVYICPNF
jgi:hypothetical protein